jgi:hypothetical protein
MPAITETDVIEVVEGIRIAKENLLGHLDLLDDLDHLAGAALSETS